jgi:hypothetical protein
MLLKGALGLFSCLALSACNIGGVAQASPSPLESSTPVVMHPSPSRIGVYPGPSLGPAPTNCSRPTVHAVNSSVGPGIGTSPVFAVGAWDANGVLHADRATKVQYGEQVKVLWVLAPTTNQPVSLHGGSIGTGLPLYFEVGDSSPTTSPTLAPAAAPQNEGGWTYFPSYLDMPAAGCYYLEVDWSGGHWRLEFPAGD